MRRGIWMTLGATVGVGGALLLSRRANAASPAGAPAGNDTPPPVTGLDGRIPVVIGFAAKKSYEEKRLVRLSEVDPASAPAG